jgi:catechol 2,3-dioxygenase-like lactoylglutathione lyase family enzyme
MNLIRISLNVVNLSRSQKFFTELGFRKSRVPPFAPPSAQSCVLALGDQAIELVEHHPHGASYPSGSTACDLWFQHFAIVTNDIAAAYPRPPKAGTTSISQNGPQTLPPNAGNVIAYKFRDPDGHPLELLQFPSNNTVRIDHSAISVSDAERSIAFYGLLGLQQTARQTNAGPAQDHLDGLSNVDVEVVALAAPGAPPPHLELLCYKHPRGRDGGTRGRHDIADTTLVFAADDLKGRADTLKAAGFSASPGERSVFVRDPDGHGVELVAR